MGSVLLVRHGQASFGADDYDVLSAVGWHQSRALGRRLAEQLGPDGVPALLVRGGLRRHRETLEGMLEGSGWPGTVEVAVDPGWDEFDHLGVIASHPEMPAGPLDRRAFQRLFDEATTRWFEAGDDVPAGAETWDAFCARVRGALHRTVDRAGPGRTVVVATSGGPVGVCAAGLVDPGADRAGHARLWARLNAVVVNTSVSRVLVGGSGTRLLTFNEHPHVAGELLTYR